MRTLLAVAIAVGGILSVHSTADAREPRRSTRVPYDFVPPPSDATERSQCEDRAQNEDPAGRYAGYPCWAREVFGRRGR